MSAKILLHFFLIELQFYLVSEFTFYGGFTVY